MATIPEDIQERIKRLSEVTEIPIESLMARLKEIITTDETALTMEDVDFKIRFACAMLVREHSMTGKATDCILQPITNPRVREITIKGEKTTVGDLTALIQILKKDEAGVVTKDDVKYASGTFWRDGAKNLENLEVGKRYKTALRITENDWGATITSDRSGFVEVKDKMGTFEEFYKKEIESGDVTITIGEMDLNKSETTTDIKVIIATVIESDVGESADGREYGRYNIMDDSVIGSNFAIFVDPKDVCWMQGSVLKFGGTISIDNKTGQVRWNNQFILPTELSMPKELEIKPVTEKQETVDISEEKPGPETELKKQPKADDDTKKKGGVFEI